MAWNMEAFGGNMAAAAGPPPSHEKLNFFAPVTSPCQISQMNKCNQVSKYEVDVLQIFKFISDHDRCERYFALDWFCPSIVVVSTTHNVEVQ